MISERKMALNIFKVILTTRDFFFFASFDYKIGFTQDAIHDYVRTLE